LLLTAASACAQFSSGSTGSDGALNYTTAGTFVFDPAALGLDASGDNIFNFTTINIASGVTLQLRSSKLRGKPVIWLASGAVTIAGTLDVSGNAGIAVITRNLGNRTLLPIPDREGHGGLGGVAFQGQTSAATGAWARRATGARNDDKHVHGLGSRCC